MLPCCCRADSLLLALSCFANCRIVSRSVIVDPAFAVLLVVRPLLLQPGPGVSAAEVAAAHQLAVEAVADALHLVLLVDVGDDFHAPLFQPLDELRGRHPAPDHVVRKFLEYDTSAGLPRPRCEFHFGLGQTFPHRLLTRDVGCKVELPGQLPRDLLGTLEVFRVADRAAFVVDRRGQNVELAVVVLVPDSDPRRLVEPPARGVHLGHPRLRFRGDVVFLPGADRGVEDLALDLRPAGGDRLHLAPYLLRGAAGHVSGDQFAAELTFGLPLAPLLPPGRRLRALKVFLEFGAVPTHLR